MYAGLQKTLLSIKAGHSASIKEFTAFPAEEELLLFPGTVLDVLNVKRISK